MLVRATRQYLVIRPNRQEVQDTVAQKAQKAQKAHKTHKDTKPVETT